MRIALFSCFLMMAGFVFPQKDRQAVFTDKAPKPIGPYSQAIRAGNTVYVSGQIALKPDGSLDSSSVENETKQVMENLKAVLEASKMDFSNVVKTTIYLTDLRNFKVVNETYGAFFTSNPPARETVEVRALPKGAHIEISVIAVK